jgi:DNA-binding transcriptional LysR family regulator
MGRLVDSNLGARYLGRNPWSVVASPQYLRKHGIPQAPYDLTSHEALIISTVQNDSLWHFRGVNGEELAVKLKGPMRSNNKSALMKAACAGLGIAALPTYIVHGCIQSGELQTLLADWTLPKQEIHAVYPSPRMVPAKVNGFVEWLQQQLTETWWTTHFCDS